MSEPSNPGPIDTAALVAAPPSGTAAIPDSAAPLAHDARDVDESESTALRYLTTPNPVVVPPSVHQEPDRAAVPVLASLDQPSACSGELGSSPPVPASTNCSQPLQPTASDGIDREIDDAVSAQMAAFQERKRANGNVFVTVSEDFKTRNLFRDAEYAKRGITAPHNRATVEMQKTPFAPQTLEKFLEKELPEKKPLIDGLLYKRDIVALAGRRRHGKTTFTGNLALSLTIPRTDFLGFHIPQACRVLAFYLEDDAGELQIRFRKMSGESSLGERLSLYTRDDFYSANVGIDGGCKEFRNFVRAACEAHEPDLIILDNLAHLVSANYNDSKVIHTLMQFLWRLSNDFDAAIIIAAHPRKRDKESPSRLRDDREGFFEEVMGSSHFVNCCGSLWAIERDQDSDRTDFFGGAQRFTGQQELMTLEKDDSDWLRRVNDGYLSLANALNTEKRKQAWNSLPSRAFSYTEAERAVKSVLKSASSFHAFFQACRREGVIIALGELYIKAPGIEMGIIEV